METCGGLRTGQPNWVSRPKSPFSWLLPKSADRIRDEAGHSNAQSSSSAGELDKFFPYHQNESFLIPLALLTVHSGIVENIFSGHPNQKGIRVERPPSRGEADDASIFLPHLGRIPFQNLITDEFSESENGTGEPFGVCILSVLTDANRWKINANKIQSI